MPPGCWGILPMLLYMIPYGCVKLLDPKILNKIQSVLKNAELTLNARRSGRETGKRSSHLVLVIFFWVDQYSIRWVVLQDSHTWSLQSVHINRMSIFFADLIIPTPSWSFILLFFYSIIIFVYSYLCFFIVYSIFNVIFVFLSLINLFTYIYICLFIFIIIFFIFYFFYFLHVLNICLFTIIGLFFNYFFIFILLIHFFIL